MALGIQVNEKKAGFVEVALDGRLDTDTAPELEKRLSATLAGSPRAVRFDMSRLSYVSSMGIRVLFKAFKALREKKAAFLMVNLQPQIKKVFDIAQALPPETVFSSVEEADEYFDAMQQKALGQDVELD
jgi:anti-anti-sigma factor